MKRIIKKYNGKTGDVIIAEYEENNTIEYCIEHLGQAFQAHWTKDKVEAIKRAQFLSRY